MMAREKGMDPKQVASEMDTYVTDYARWNAERHATNAYPPNLDSIYEYITLYGGDPNWKPKVPDLREFETYRSIADMTPVLPTANEPIITNTSFTPQAPAPDASKGKANSPGPGAKAVKGALPQKKK
jgi:hypothetical protein